jgi:hypothetical protein
VGHAQHRLRLRRAPGPHAFDRETSLKADEPRVVLSPDTLIVPALLLLVARDLLLFDPPRVLAWRLLHDERWQTAPAWLSLLWPRPSGAIDRDPIALLLGALAVLLAVAYLAAGLARVGRRARGALLAGAAVLLVVIPTLAFMAMGFATGRPYGQDGGVVQLPLAIDHILAGKSPYGADYSDSILGKQARVSDFWDERGGNPILHHHAYLPGTHLLMLPFHLVSRALLGAFDPRVVTLLAFGAAALLAFRVAGGGDRGLAASAVVLVSPLVYWQQIFGANDVVLAALLLGAVVLADRGRPLASGALLGLACATKQLAWPFAPFLLAHFSQAGGLRELVQPPALKRMAGPAVAALAVFAAAVLPVLALDPRAFWSDIVVYNVGLPGGDNYPLGGTPGFGFANFLIYFGAVTSLRDHVSFAPFYLLLVPLGLLLLREQLRAGTASAACVTGSVALLASVYFSRVVHPNYLILVAILLPVGFLAGFRRPPAVAAVPLLLLLLAVEIAEGAVFATTWQDALAARLPQHLRGLEAALAPRAGPQLTEDPLGLLFSATAAGLALVWLAAGVLGAGRRVRLALAVSAIVAVAILPARTMARVGTATGAPRAQDAWLAGIAPGTAQEAWSQSFRNDPPGSPPQSSVVEQPGQAAVAVVMSALGLRDPRSLTLLALAAIAIVLAAFAPEALALSLLIPAIVTGFVFGSGDLLCLFAILAGALFARTGRWLGAGAALGAGAVLAPQTVLVAPLWLAAAESERGAIRRAALGLAAGLLVVLALFFLSPFEGFAPASLAAGLGLVNVAIYFGAEPAGLAWAWPPVLVFGAAVALAPRLAARPEAERWAAAAALLLAGLWLWPGASPHALATPLALLALAAAQRATFDSPAARP